MNPPVIQRTATPRIADKTAVLLSKRPRERRHVGRSLALSIFIHLFIAALVCLITYWLGITTLKDLLERGGSIAESGPAPEKPMTVELQLDQPPPLPTPNPVVIQQIVKPKIIPPPVTPKESVVSPKKSVVKTDTKPRPRYTAPNARGEGKTQNISPARVGTSGLPSPSYPEEALARHEGGTVGMRVVFGPDGRVAEAEVQESSGVVILDVSTRNFVYRHWKNASLANTTIHVPVIYNPSYQSIDGSP